MIRLKAPLGVREFFFARLYGFISVFQDDVLLISDPKALQYIVQTAAYRYPKHKEMNALGDLITGPGLVSAVGTWRPKNDFESSSILNPNLLRRHS